MQVTFSTAALPKTGAIIIPVFEDGKKAKAYQDINAKTDGALDRAAKAASYKPKKGRFLEIMSPAGIGNGRVVLIGAGATKDFTALDAEALGGRVIARLQASREKTAVFALDGLSVKKLNAGEMAARVAHGARMRSYRFDKYRTTVEKDDKPALTKIAVHSSAGAKAAYAPHEKIGDGVFLTRDLVAEPANVLYPDSFAKRCQKLTALGVKVKVLGVPEMKKLGMGSLLGVGLGSEKPSRLVAMEWMGGKKGDAPLALVGKGVTIPAASR